MPRITYCIVLEMIYMFIYAILTVVCRHDFMSHRSHAIAWLLFLLYFVFWAK